MNYLHAFHAGNFADVHKHAVLIALLKAMMRKDIPLFYLETHAGGGIYDFSRLRTNQPPEWQEGIGYIWRSSSPHSASLRDYLAIISAFNPQGNLRYYPGSPLIADNLLRSRDRMILLEANFPEAQRLEMTLNRNKKINLNSPRKIHVRVGDGYLALQAWLPPKQERRGIIFIDPPFEQAQEFRQILSGLITIQRYFATGVIAIWYPLKNHTLIKRFYRDLRDTGLRRLLITELRIFPDDIDGRFYGSGLLIHNPPWQLDQEFSALGTELASLFSSYPEARSIVQWLRED